MFGAFAVGAFLHRSVSFSLPIFATVLFLAGAWGAAAQGNAAADYNNPWAEGGYSPIPLPEVEGTLPWDVLHQVELVFEGPDMVPEYADEVRALDGATVRMVGFMLPLDSSGQRVLLSQYAPHCPFCTTAGPESFVELRCDPPLALSLDPIVVQGRLEVIDGAWDGYYYRMTDVALVHRFDS